MSMPNLENSMVIGKEYPDTWDKAEESSDEVSQILEQWLINSFKPNEMMDLFFDSWSKEFYSFMKAGTFEKEFNDFAVKSLTEDFRNETGFEPDEVQIKNFIES